MVTRKVFCGFIISRGQVFYYFQHQVKIFNVEIASMDVMVPDGISWEVEVIEIVAFRGDDVVFFYEGRDAFFRKVVPSENRVGGIRFNDIAKFVFRKRAAGKREVAAVVKKTIIIRFVIFPGPILSGELAVHWVFF